MAERKIKVAINGLGRIGRAFLKIASDRPEIEIVAVNDLAEIKNIAYLIKYDTVYGVWPGEVEAVEGNLLINNRPVKFLSIADPKNLPWKDLAIDVVIEATGVFAGYDKSRAHLDAGARKVVISAPVKDDPPVGIGGATVLMGINQDQLNTCQISSNASCTTNAVSPLIKILNDAVGIEKAVLNTVHGYTASQKLVDSPDAKDFRRGRAGAQNIIPSTTGAAIAVTKVMPELTDKFDGLAMRVPVPTGSLVDLTFIAKRETTVEEVNGKLKAAAADPAWQAVFTVTEDPIVSADIIGSSYASIADLAFTKVIGGNLVKVLAWYDNEMGYTHTLIQHVLETGSR
ncbi:MAG: type I glyceraldehyde-3-phosphate dehydrogenase [Candidatus Paceibacterota bacterium]